MKTKTNDELRRNEIASGELRMATGLPEWWAGLPEGEKNLIRTVMRLLQGAKHSQVQEVADAASEWERTLGCFIRVRLKWRGKVEGRGLRVEGQCRPAASGRETEQGDSREARESTGGAPVVPGKLSQLDGAHGVIRPTSIQPDGAHGVTRPTTDQTGGAHGVTRPTAYRSGGRSRPGVSPARG